LKSITSLRFKRSTVEPIKWKLVIVSPPLAIVLGNDIINSGTGGNAIIYGGAGDDKHNGGRGSYIFFNFKHCI
jgi:Ca2+-binding RTX toxin-like protein